MVMARGPNSSPYLPVPDPGSPARSRDGLGIANFIILSGIAGLWHGSQLFPDLIRDPVPKGSNDLVMAYFVLLSGIAWLWHGVPDQVREREM